MFLKACWHALGFSILKRVFQSLWAWLPGPISLSIFLAPSMILTPLRIYELVANQLIYLTDNMVVEFTTKSYRLRVKLQLVTCNFT